jgi:hypothetical protein
MAASLRRIGIALLLSLAAIYAALYIAIRQPTFRSIPLRAAARARPERLRADVVALTGMQRCADGDLEAAASYIENQFRRTRAEVTSQRFTARHAEFRNVIATFGPKGMSLPVTIVGAHYDAYCFPGPKPGADDNASGVAGLLELARLLSTIHVVQPVMVVAYANEEPPFFASDAMGSAVHARSLRESGTRVGAMLCLEMIGCYTSDEQPYTSWLMAALCPRRGDFVAVVGRWSDRPLAREVKRAMRGAHGIEVASFNGPRSLGIDASDQRNYWDAGYPAVMINDTAYLRNPRYHTADDTADTLDYARMAAVVDGVLNMLSASPPAGAAEVPRK